MEKSEFFGGAILEKVWWLRVSDETPAGDLNIAAFGALWH
jgi:hypothetical protein